MGILCSFLLPLWAQAQVEIEYTAHACFVVQSPTGTRIVLDPYNGYRWLGYSFPAHVDANAVLITHPHYDHDASYYWSPDVPALRTPGQYRVGDVQIEGIRGKHAGPYGKDFGQINTIWLLEVGGLRIAHLGDNGPLSEEAIRALGRVDVLMIPVDSLYHILTQDQIDKIRSALRPRVTIPMHYRIPSLSDQPRSLGPIDPWLEGRDNVVRLDTNRTVLARKSLPRTEQIFVFSPSPAVRPWSSSLRLAWGKVRTARELLRRDSPAALRDAVEQLRRATELFPEAILFWWELGKALKAAGETQEAIRTLERGLAGAGQDDWEYTMGARAFLAKLYEATGKRESAARQYRLILAGSYRTELRKRAERFLQTRGSCE